MRKLPISLATLALSSLTACTSFSNQRPPSHEEVIELSNKKLQVDYNNLKKREAELEKKLEEKGYN